MLKHYFLTTLRLLYRDRLYTAINLLGLSIAIISFLVLGSYVQNELTYDQHNRNKDQIVRLVMEVDIAGGTFYSSVTSPQIGPVIEREYPHLGEFLRFQQMAKGPVVYQDQSYVWDDVYFADDNVFEVLTHHIIYGDAGKALKEASSIAISARFARTYFGDKNPIGEKMQLLSYTYTVDAVFKDLPENSHLQYNALVSYNFNCRPRECYRDTTPLQALNNAWNTYTYFHLQPGVSTEDVETVLDDYIQRALTESANNSGPRNEARPKIRVQNLTDTHYASGWLGDQANGNLFYVYGLGLTGLLILLIAYINYTNIVIARGANRAKEISMRRFIGAKRWQLLLQFMLESGLVTAIACVTALTTIEIIDATTSISHLFDKTKLLSLSDRPLEAALFCICVLLIGTISGLYPGLQLLQADSTGKNIGGRSRSIVQASLLFIQYSVSAGVVICALVMATQVNYMFNKPRGFEKSNLLSARLYGVDTLKAIPRIKAELKNNSFIEGVSVMADIIGDNDANVSIDDIYLENADGKLEPTIMDIVFVGDDFVEVLNIPLVEGRGFNPNIESDLSSAVLVNETMVKQMGWESAIGKGVKLDLDEEDWVRIVGVVNDFHIHSLHKPMQPILIRQYPNNLDTTPEFMQNTISRNLVVRFKSGYDQQAIDAIQQAIKSVSSAHPQEFQFFDVLINREYRADTNIMWLTQAFAGICVLLSCMGLFGLTALSAEKRRKDIGIRKVLGATSIQIVIKYIRQFALLFALGAVAAFAGSRYIADVWLNNFAYRTDIQWWILLLPALLLAILALSTAGLQFLRASTINPVDALRHD